MYIVVIMNVSRMDVSRMDVSCMYVIQTSKYGVENGRCIAVGRYKGSTYLSARFIRARKDVPMLLLFTPHLINYR